MNTDGAGGPHIPPLSAHRNKSASPERRNAAEGESAPPPKPKRRKSSNSESNALDSILSRFGISPSLAVGNILTEAAEDSVANSNSDGSAWLDCESLFLAFLTVGLSEHNAPYADSSLPLDLVRRLRVNDASLIAAKRAHIERKNKRINTSNEHKGPIVWDHLFLDFWGTAQTIKKQCSPRRKWLAARHLLAALVEFSVVTNGPELEVIRSARQEIIDALLRNRRLYATEDSRQGWADFFSRYGSENIRNGDNHDFCREGDERHAALKVGEYAEAFARFFESAGNEECCLAVFAPWGRGKSFLMKRLGARLERSRYTTIFFQAWKYPSRPEVWVHLYETMARAALDRPWWQRWPRIFRIGLEKHGHGVLICALLGLAFSTYPKLHLAFQTLSWLSAIIAAIGLGSFVWLVIFFASAGRSVKKLSKHYLSAPTHAEKLGLQATVGGDLSALLAAWMPQNRWPGLLPVIGYLSLIWLMFESASYWGKFAPFGFLRGNSAFGSMLPWLVSGTFFLVSAWLLSWFGRPKRILLVVDDLDRCSFEHLVSVMESVKLLIEDKKIGRCLQVAMLVEEEVLRAAILDKYSKVRVSKNGGLSDERIIRESCEKLFTVHLARSRMSSNVQSERIGGV